MSGEITTGFIASELSARGYRVIPGPDRTIAAGAADSRLVQPGDLFAAFRGESLDGNVFVPAALTAGAAAIICEREPDAPTGDATIVIVPDTIRALHELARAWLDVCKPRVIGITGTVGKTTAKELTGATLRTRVQTHWSQGNFNSREGLPLAVMSLRNGDRVSVLEMGMDSPGEIVQLCETARPEVGVVLNIGLTHVSKLGSIDAIAEEKLSLARWLPESGTAILNADDPRIAAAVDTVGARTITFGASPSATLRLGDVTDRGLAGTRFTVTYGGESAEACSPLPGQHVIPAALSAIGSCLALGVSLAEATAALSAAEPEGRLRQRTAASGATILDDRYNASPASVAGALRLLGTLESGKRYALLGVMAELGDHEEAEHRAIGALAASTCDALYAVGEPCRAMVESALAAGLADARWFTSKDDAAAALAARLGSGDHVLVKASRSQAFETVIPILEGAE
ncbi:MAG: UDP-N-acetylmuramoyl-tripeptide--D-alanyl-D-alanine ligase [Tepidiformaceae bacterium]